MKTALRKEDQSRLRQKDRSDRATVEQVLDPRTRAILLKMMKNGVIHEVNGCISTGKEVNRSRCRNFSKGPVPNKDLHVRAPARPTSTMPSPHPQPPRTLPSKSTKRAS